MKRARSDYIVIIGFIAYFVANVFDVPAKLRAGILGVTLIIYIISIVVDVIKKRQSH